MGALVSIHNGELKTTSLAIAEGTRLEHASVIKLTRTYHNDLEEFGSCRFEIAKSGGRPTEYALLNEPQATLIMTYMKNTPIVREFKKRLVRAFYELSSSNTMLMQHIRILEQRLSALERPRPVIHRRAYNLSPVTRELHAIG